MGEIESSKEFNPPPLPAVQAGTSQPMFFSVSPTKLVVMTIFTLGFYEVYWFYKHWNQVRISGLQKVLPFIRAMFAVLTCYSLFTKIKNVAFEQGVQADFNPGILALTYIVAVLFGRLADAWNLPFIVSLLSFASVAVLIPVQRVANALNLQRVPGIDLNERFTGANIFWIILGSLAWLLVAVGLLTTPADVSLN